MGAHWLKHFILSGEYVVHFGDTAFDNAASDEYDTHMRTHTDARLYTRTRAHTHTHTHTHTPTRTHTHAHAHTLA